MVEQHVEVAHGAEQAGQELQLLAERGKPVAEQRPRGTDERTRAPRGHAQLVEILRVTEADAGVVRFERIELLFEHVSELLVERCIAGGPGRRRQLEHPHELRLSRALERSGVAKHATEALQVGLVALADQLDLELREPGDTALGVEDRDLVDRHVGNLAAILLDADSRTVRPQRCDRLEAAVARVRDEEPRQCGRRSARAARLLELDSLAHRSGCGAASAATATCRSRPGGEA